MKNKIKQLVKFILIKAFGLVNVQVLFLRMDYTPDIVTFDKNKLESYSEHNMKIQLYYEGLKKAKMERSFYLHYFENSL
jgi:hypothetical protein